jgi:hypothetical protein
MEPTIKRSQVGPYVPLPHHKGVARDMNGTHDQTITGRTLCSFAETDGLSAMAKMSAAEGSCSADAGAVDAVAVLLAAEEACCRAGAAGEAVCFAYAGVVGCRGGADEEQVCGLM